jgi:hypothetical protein
MTISLYNFSASLGLRPSQMIHEFYFLLFR